MKSLSITLLLSCILTVCYGDYIFVNKLKNWWDAQTYCRDKISTDLATILTDEDYSLAKSLLNDTQNKAWIGLNDLGHHDNFTWSNGEDCALPNNECTDLWSTDVYYGHCVVLHTEPLNIRRRLITDNSEGFMTLPCVFDQAPFLCNTPDITTTPTNTTGNNSPSATINSTTSTDSPTTNEPTTSSPTTSAPTTSSPTSSSPTTSSPTTFSPTTTAPTTDAPTTNAPTTNAPTTDSPTSTTKSPTSITESPTLETKSPSLQPTLDPTAQPSSNPTLEPTAEPSAAPTKHDYEVNEDYIFNKEPHLNFYDARQFCMDRYGTDLATIQTAEDLESALSFEDQAQWMRLWIGLYSTKKEGWYKWMDGTPCIEPRYGACVTGEFWFNGKPECFQEGGYNCTTLFVKENQFINSFNCRGKMPFLCNTLAKENSIGRALGDMIHLDEFVGKEAGNGGNGGKWRVWGMDLVVVLRMFVCGGIMLIICCGLFVVCFKKLTTFKLPEQYSTVTKVDHCDDSDETSDELDEILADSV